METEKLYRKYQLAKASAELRSEAIEYIIKLSKGQIDDKLIRGMMMLITEIDSWVTSYEGLLKQRKEENNG